MLTRSINPIKSNFSQTLFFTAWDIQRQNSHFVVTSPSILQINDRVGCAFFNNLCMLTKIMKKI